MESVKKYYNEYYANRDGAIDICRGICILLVIIGHQLQNQGLVSTMQIIYSFHMPLMFIISGFFIKKENNCKFIQKKNETFISALFFGDYSNVYCRNVTTIDAGTVSIKYIVT